MTDFSEIVAVQDGSTKTRLRYTSGAESDNTMCFIFLQSMDRLGKTPQELRSNLPPKPTNLSDADWVEVRRVIATFT